LVDRAMAEFGRLDILVNNAAYQQSIDRIEDLTVDEWQRTMRTNLDAMFYLCKAAVPVMRPGSAIVNTTSVQSKSPTPELLAYATTKGGIAKFTAGLAGMLGDRGIRVNAVAPGPIWTLIPATLPADKVESFGSDTALGRVGQPAELAGAFVPAGVGRGQLHDRSRDPGHRRPADALRTPCHRGRARPCLRWGIASSGGRGIGYYPQHTPALGSLTGDRHLRPKPISGVGARPRA
jgi:NAD(P)-dependent dehydrogenase (short-subunit alcohol dehydrogenase family)